MYVFILEKEGKDEPSTFTDNRLLSKPKPSIITGLMNEQANGDGTYDGLCVQKSQSTFLFYMSNMALFSGSYAVYQGYYDLAACAYVVWLTSLNYWRLPDYSWRRYFDITCVNIALGYHMFHAYRNTNATAYYAVVSLGISFYFIGVYFFYKQDSWASTVCHANVHLFGNVANTILYAGTLVPL